MCHMNRIMHFVKLTNPITYNKYLETKFHALRDMSETCFPDGHCAKLAIKYAIHGIEK